jgi:hypothetical protein
MQDLKRKSSELIGRSTKVLRKSDMLEKETQELDEIMNIEHDNAELAMEKLSTLQHVHNTAHDKD